MAFRTVIIKDRCKLEYSLNYMVLYKENIEKRVLLSEIKIIIIDSLQVSLTTAFIAACIENNIKIIFSDSKHNPLCELCGYNNNYYSYRKIKEQINFDNSHKDILWKYIIIEKIKNQANNLKYANEKEAYEKLISYASEVVNGDLTNREGHSAKVYFNSLFGTDFSRKDDNRINKYLNYGYSIILSLINREIKGYGYLTELGIHHIGESNQFNLSCDLIEPFRPLVDSYVLKNKINDENFKTEFVNMLSKMVMYNEREIIFDNAIHLYIDDLLCYLKTGDISKIKFIKYEL